MSALGTVQAGEDTPLLEREPLRRVIPRPGFVGARAAAGRWQSTADGLPDVLPVLLGREGLLVLGLAAAWYVLGVWYLMVYLQWYDPDTLSRLANAFYVLYSREPHLAAVGFVWPPLFSAAMLPLLLLYPLWPAVASYGLAAGALSAATGALFLAVTFALLRAGGFPRVGCWIFTATLAVNPMWWYASTNGLTEMPFLLLLLVSLVLLWRWLAAPATYYLAVLVNGALCAAALMVRYEMVAWALMLTGITLLGSFLSGSHDWSGGIWARVQRAQAFAIAFALPPLFALLAWIFFNWQIVGDPLYFLNSAYSNVAQTGLDFAWVENPVLAPAVGSVGGALEFVLVRAAYLNPALFVCVPLAAVVAWRRGHWQGLALAAPALAILLFDAAMLYRATLNSLLRYHLFTIPTTIVLVVWLYRKAAGMGPRLRRLTTVLVLAAGWLMAGTSAWAMADPTLGHGTTDAFVHFLSATPSHGFDADRALAGYLDSLQLPDGSVLMDSANGYGVIISSRRPKQFVINSDSEFLATLADPMHRVGYVAIGATDNFSILDTTYPRLFQTGEPFGTPEREFVGGLRMGASAPTIWRLYRVGEGPATSSVPSSAPEPTGGTTPDEPPADQPLTPVPTDAPLSAPMVGTPVPSVPLARITAPHLLLDERFGPAARSHGWPLVPGAAWADTLGYRLAAGATNHFVAVDAPVAPVREVLVTARFRKTGGPPGGGYGLIVQDEGPTPRDGIDQGGQYYVFELNDRGEFGIWRRQQDHWVDLRTWTFSPSAHPGDATNELEVQAAGDEFLFRINSVLVAYLQGGALADGRVGVFLGGDLNQGLLTHFTVSALD